MTRLPSPEILISEVGPRDGLQSVKTTMPTADKLRWIDALAAAGLREIEVASFVPAQLLPQMADAAQVVQHALRHSGVRVMALVPNLRGAQAALQAGAQKLTLPVSASPAHSMANVRKTPEAMVEEVRAVLRLRDEIAAVFEQKGDHRGLHRRGGDDAQLLQTTDHLRWNSEGGKGMGVGF